MNNYNDMFEYQIFNETNTKISINLINIIEKALDKWNSIITYNPSGRVIRTDIFFKNMGKINVLGNASPIYAIGNNFGDMFTTRAKITLNIDEISDFDDNFIYYAILHEVGHALGIGVYWYYDNSPIKRALSEARLTIW